LPEAYLAQIGRSAIKRRALQVDVEGVWQSSTLKKRSRLGPRNGPHRVIKSERIAAWGTGEVIKRRVILCGGGWIQYTGHAQARMEEDRHPPGAPLEKVWERFGTVTALG
jgi:hypothetical protein